MPKHVDHLQRRRTIVEALGRIAARQGLAAVTMRHVAAEAGISLGQVQHYFPSKDALLLDALHQLAERVGHRVQGAVQDLGPDASERDRIRVTLIEFLPLDDERRAATTLFRAFHEGGVNDPRTVGKQAAEVPFAFDATLRRRFSAAGEAGQLRPGVSVEAEAATLQLVIASLGEAMRASLVTPDDATALIDYLLDRAFLP